MRPSLYVLLHGTVPVDIYVPLDRVHTDILGLSVQPLHSHGFPHLFFLLYRCKNWTLSYYTSAPSCPFFFPPLAFFWRKQEGQEEDYNMDRKQKLMESYVYFRNFPLLSKSPAHTR